VRRMVWVSLVIGSMMMLGSLDRVDAKFRVERLHNTEITPPTVTLSHKPIIFLKTVNDITLIDNPLSVEQKKGRPLVIKNDPQLKDIVIYSYKEQDVAFRDGALLYVSIPSDSGTFDVDGNTVSMVLSDIENVLGIPDFLAEDGWVYIRREGALKLYFDEQQVDKVALIHFFQRSGI
jgi:hypothetical protein